MQARKHDRGLLKWLTLHTLNVLRHAVIIYAFWTLQINVKCTKGCLKINPMLKSKRGLFLFACHFCYTVMTHTYSMLKKHLRNNAWLLVCNVFVRNFIFDCPVLSISYFYNARLCFLLIHPSKASRFVKKQPSPLQKCNSKLCLRECVKNWRGKVTFFVPIYLNFAVALH